MGIKYFPLLIVCSAVTMTVSLSLPLEAMAETKKTTKQEDASATVLDRVMVIGNAENIQNITGSAHYIDAEQLEKFTFTDVHRVLRSVPGVNVQEEEGFGNRPNISIRGGRSERSADITLMEDGILAAPAPYAAPSAYYFPRVLRMEGVEVMKGPSSIEFGPRTTSGAINFLSSSIPSERRGKANVAYGQENGQKSHLQYGNSADNVGYVFDFTHEASDGFKDIDIVGGDTGFSIQDVVGKMRFSSDPSANMFQFIEFKVGGTQERSDETYLGLTNQDFDADPYRRYAATQNDFFKAWHRQYLIRHYIEPTDNLDITTSLYRNDFKRNWNKIQSVTVGNDTKSLSSALDSTAHLNALKGLTDLDGSATDNITLRQNNRRYYSQGIQTNVGTSVDVGKVENDLTFGIRYHYDEEDRLQSEDRYSINNGVMELTNLGAPGSNADRKGSATALAVHVLDEIEYGDWNFTPGLRYENIELKRDDTNNGTIFKNHLNVFIPGIGVGYKANQDLSFFGGVHKGFAPPGPSSDTAQKEEESINYELGTRYNQGALKTEVVGYFNDYSNLLGEDTLVGGGGGGTGDQFNGGKVHAYGVEFLTEYDVADLMDTPTYRYPVRFNYTYTKATFETSFNSTFAEWGNVTSGDELPYIPEHQFTLGAGIVDDTWQFNIQGTFVGEMRTTAGQGDIAAGEGTDEHFIVDVSGEYEFYKDTRAYFTVNNLFDEEYVAARRPAGARPGLPQIFFVGLKYNF